LEPPPELVDPDAPVWRTHEAFLAYMAKRGWLLPARDRLRVVDPEIAGPVVESPTHWDARRRRAVWAWARAAGLVGGGMDWDGVHALLEGPEALRSAARRAARRSAGS